MDWLSTVEESPAQAAPPSSTAEFVRGLDAFFRARPRFWRNVGAQRSFRGQFCIEGGDDFFITVDGEGARAQLGSLEAADVTWRSDAVGLKDALGGRLNREHPVTIRGDVNTLRSVFRALVSC